MADEYKSQCGCVIHVAQWTSKRKIVTQKSCSLHLAAADLLEACKSISKDGADWLSDEASAMLSKAIAKAEHK